MEIMRELEEEFAARRLANSSSRITLHAGGHRYCLDEARLALDFILGRSGNRVYFFPNQSISEVFGLDIQNPLDENLAGILSSQRQPVKLVLAAPSELQGAWLLNVERDWMRVAGQEGVVWIPITRLLVAETDLLVGGSNQ